MKTPIQIIDFLVAKIDEEKNDAGAYMEWAHASENQAVKETLSKIADEELEHQKCLVMLLANMAKEGTKANV